MEFAFLFLLILKFPGLFECANIPDQLDEIFLKPIFDKYQLKHPAISEVIDFTDYNRVTKSNTGCACWFDPFQLFTESGDCACCKNVAVQCGYPMHNWCQRKVDDGEEQQGCQGIFFGIF